jgi:2-iminobutanoate/2-iminopropanoate deaminase
VHRSTCEAITGIAGLIRQGLDNLKGLLTVGGTSLDKVVKVTVLLTKLKDFANTNGVYRTYFSTNPPVCPCLEVKSLSRDGLESEYVAAS